MSDELSATTVGGIAVAVGTLITATGAFLLNWRKAGYTELAELADRQEKAIALQGSLLSALQAQITELHRRINSGHKAIINAEDRAAASEKRAANAEMARLLIEKRYGEEVAELRAEIEVLRQQIIAAGLTPKTRGARA